MRGKFLILAQHQQRADKKLGSIAGITQKPTCRGALRLNSPASVTIRKSDYLEERPCRESACFITQSIRRLNSKTHGMRFSGHVRHRFDESTQRAYLKPRKGGHSDRYERPHHLLPIELLVGLIMQSLHPTILLPRSLLMAFELKRCLWDLNVLILQVRVTYFLMPSFILPCLCRT